jgi:hypothetical protein
MSVSDSEPHPQASGPHATYNYHQERTLPTYGLSTDARECQFVSWGLLVLLVGGRVVVDGVPGCGLCWEVGSKGKERFIIDQIQPPQHIHQGTRVLISFPRCLETSCGD